MTQPDPPNTSPPASAGAVEKTEEISALDISIPGGDTGASLTLESVLHHTLDQDPGGGALATCASFVQGLMESSGVHPQKARKLSEDLDQALESCSARLISVRRHCKIILSKGQDAMLTVEAKDNTAMQRALEYLDAHIDRLSRRIRPLMDYGEELRKRDSTHTRTKINSKHCWMNSSRGLPNLEYLSRQQVRALVVIHVHV